MSECENMYIFLNRIVHAENNSYQNIPSNVKKTELINKVAERHIHMLSFVCFLLFYPVILANLANCEILFSKKNQLSQSNKRRRT
jgi:hypothetical protein